MAYALSLLGKDGVIARCHVLPLSNTISFFHMQPHGSIQNTKKLINSNPESTTLKNMGFRQL